MSDRIATLPATDRTELVAHYVISRSVPEELGAVKLNKVMWFADIEAYRTLGRTITGQLSYEKRQHGPVPNNIVTSIRRLEQADKIETRSVPTFGGTRREHLSLVKPDIGGLSVNDVDILNQAIDWVCVHHTAKSISEYSHDALWEAAEIGEQIPIGAAAVVPDEICSADLVWAEGVLTAANA